MYTLREAPGMDGQTPRKQWGVGKKADAAEPSAQGAIRNSTRPPHPAAAGHHVWTPGLPATLQIAELLTFWMLKRAEGV